MEFYRMAGEYDYMMKVQVKDMQCFDSSYKKAGELCCRNIQRHLNVCYGAT